MAKRGIKQDLQHRLQEAEESGRGISPLSSSDARRLNAAVARGDLLSPARGVYVRPHVWNDLKPTKRDLVAARTLQQLHPDWVFCEATAALAYGMAVSYVLTGSVHVATSRRSHTRSAGCRGVSRHIVTGDQFDYVAGLRVTSVERTTFDCLRKAGFRDGLAVADSVLFNGLASSEQLLAAFEDYDYHLVGRRKALDTMALADGRAENGGESVARAVMIELGYRRPELQHVVKDIMQDDDDDSYRVDFYWDLGDEGSIIGELDGREKYVNPEMTDGRSMLSVLADERLRESRVSGSGAKIMRFSYAQAVNRSYFSRLLDRFGVPRDAPIPPVALHADDYEALATCQERRALGRWQRLRPSFPRPVAA